MSACEATQRSLEPLRLRSEFPFLRVLRLDKLSITCSRAAQLGKFLGAMHLPCLEELAIEVVCAQFFRVSDTADLEDTADTALCCLVRELGPLSLPSLRILRLVASMSRYRNPEGCCETHNSCPEAHNFVNSLAALLKSTQRLQALSIVLPDMSPKHLQALAPGIASLQALTSLELSVCMDRMSAHALRVHVGAHRALQELTMVQCRLLGSCVQNWYVWLQSLPELHSIRIKPVLAIEQEVKVMFQDIQRLVKPLRKVSRVHVDKQSHVCM